MSNAPPNVPQILRLLSGLIPNAPGPEVGGETYWEKAYDDVFSEGVSRTLNQWASKVGVTIEWYDPDTTYQEDVCAYADAVLGRQKIVLSAYYRAKSESSLSPDYLEVGSRGLGTLADLSDELGIPPGEVLARAISLLDQCVMATRKGFSVGIADTDENLTTVFRGLNPA